MNLENKSIMRFNLISILIIFITLFLITYLFLSKIVGIIFLIISIVYLIFLFIYTRKLKKFNNNHEKFL